MRCPACCGDGNDCSPNASSQICKKCNGTGEVDGDTIANESQEQRQVTLLFSLVDSLTQRVARLENKLSEKQ